MFYKLVNHLEHLWLIYLPLLFATACNGDIFVEDVTPSENELTLEGDGGSGTITFQPKGLQWISINPNSSSTMPVTYYDRKDNVISSTASASEIARISYQDISLMADIRIDGNRMTFHSTESTYPYPLRVYVWLEYGYKSEGITVTVLPGKPVELAEVNYVMDNKRVWEHYQVRTTRLSWRNEGASATTVFYPPYIAQLATYFVKNDVPWFDGCDVEMPLPTYIDGQWQVPDRPVKVRFGTKEYFSPSRIDYELEEPIELPPYSHLVVSCDVTFVKINVPVFLHFRNPVSGRTYLTLSNCEVVEPDGYKINVKNEE